MSESFDRSFAKKYPGQANFFSSLGLLIILNAVIKPVWIFAIDRKVQLAVGQAEYGNYFALLNLSLVFGFLLDIGFTNYFNRQLAFNNEKFIQQAGNFLLLKIFLAGMYAAVVFLVAWLSGVQQSSIIIYLIIIQVLVSLFIFFRSVITSQQWFRTDSWLSVFDKALLIILCGSLLYFPRIFEPITINRFLFFQAICTGLAAISALGILVRRGISFGITSFPEVNKKIVEALPYGLVVFFMTMHYRLDGFLLEKLKSPEEAGLYAATYRLLDAANMVGYLFASFLLPYIARQWSLSKEIHSVVYNARKALLLYSIFIVTAVVFLSPWIGQLLYKNKIENVGEILAWTIPALIGYSLVQIYGTVLTATGNIKQFCIIIFATVVVNVILNLLLIPVYGAKGACWSAIVSQTLCGMATAVLCKARLHISFDLKTIIINILAATALSVIFFAGTKLSVNSWILLGVGGIITLLFLLLFRPNMWKYWLRLKTSVT